MPSLSISVNTTQREQFVDITTQVQQAITEIGAIDGVCTIFCPHTTAGLTINEHADPAVARDILSFLHDAVPDESAWTHAEGNSPAHVKASLLGSSVVVIVERGQLHLGTWQGIFFCEFDGPRSRGVWLTFTPSF
jgi:secondary thiamine-phosphate synthase enzyme